MHWTCAKHPCQWPEMLRKDVTMYFEKGRPSNYQRGPPKYSLTLGRVRGKPFPHHIMPTSVQTYFVKWQWQVNMNGWLLQSPSPPWWMKNLGRKVFYQASSRMHEHKADFITVEVARGPTTRFKDVADLSKYQTCLNMIEKATREAMLETAKLPIWLLPHMASHKHRSALVLSTSSHATYM